MQDSSYQVTRELDLLQDLPFDACLAGHLTMALTAVWYNAVAATRTLLHML